MISHDLSPTMRNVLEAIVEQTIKTRGPRAGQIKRRISGRAYYRHTLAALERREFINHRAETIHGTGWAATERALEVTLCKQTRPPRPKK
jgi:hypothetical protein